MPQPADRYLVGIDAGHSLIKAAVFDHTGVAVGSSRRPTAPTSAAASWQEHDMELTWLLVAAAVREAIDTAGVDAANIHGVGLSAHGDGLYLVDDDLNPVRPAILATDTRAAPTLPAGAAAAALLHTTGQLPAPYSPAALLAWLHRHEPATTARARWALHCKDWIRLRLTGSVGTDPTDAAGLTDPATGAWSPTAVHQWGLAATTRRLLPPIHPSHHVAGAVTAAAAADTGLRIDTPVVHGSHDIHAAALGIGALHDGALSAVIGTFNINQMAVHTPRVTPHWEVRQSLRPDLHLHISSSPAGAITMEWVRTITDLAAWDIDSSVTEALQQHPAADDALFIPYLYGGPPGMPHTGALLHLRGTTTRTDLLRAALEGVVHAHRFHLEQLTGQSATDAARTHATLRLTGGGAQNPDWSQLFADITGYTVDITNTDQAGARGAAILAGAGTGLFNHPAAHPWITVSRSHTPQPDRRELSDQRYLQWRTAAAALTAATN